MLVFSLEKARKQAQANANRSGKRWVLWGYPAGGWWIEEDWKGRSFTPVETFEPKVRS